MKNYVILLMLTATAYSQEDKFGKFNGGLESNSQWYLNDKELHTDHPEDPIRSNNYINANYTFKNWTAGIQVESYDAKALLNYNPKYKGTNVATYAINYKSDYFDFTAGYFYEQFGSGMILRSWEDRALGLNNALRGAKISIRPADFLSFTALFGQHRSGFDVSKGKIFGFNSDFDLGNVLNFSTSQLSIGGSFVGRDEDSELESVNFSDMTNAFSGRLNYSDTDFYINAEYSCKSEDAILNVQNKINNQFVKPGNAMLLNFGYAKKGLGIDATFRRIENMNFYSERIPANYGFNVNSLNFNDKIVNFIPALTKQHHNNLANIYVYQAQAKVDFPDPKITKAGEIGGQLDLFYTFKKESFIGGKFETDVALNVSSWYNLDGNYTFFPENYSTKFFGKEKYFSDYNIEITRKISDKWITEFTYINQFYNKKMLEGGEIVKTNIVAFGNTYSFENAKSIKIIAEHMWADADKRNWAGATVEYNLNSKFSCYVWDIYNYGNKDLEKRNHYYNIGGAYSFGPSRIAINYGRQRGGLVCVGGVCRFVPESTGLSMTLNTSF